MRNLIVLLYFCACSVVLTSGQAAPAWTPFTAVLQQEGHSEDGTITYTERMTYAVRKDGSFATSVQRRFPDGKTYEIRTVRDVVAGKQLRVDEATQSSIYLSLKGPVGKPSCNVTRNRHDVMFGYDVYRVVRRWQWDGFTHTEELWVAPALNCFPLMTLTRQPTQAAEPSAYTKTTIEKIVVAEPNTSFFEAPRNYVRRTTEEFESLMKLRFPEMPFQGTFPFAN